MEDEALACWPLRMTEAEFCAAMHNSSPEWPWECVWDDRPHPMHCFGDDPFAYQWARIWVAQWADEDADQMELLFRLCSWSRDEWSRTSFAPFYRAWWGWRRRRNA
jgi:hypothetical protein